MGTDGKRTISFSVETPERKAEILAYAKERGFHSAGALARFALYQYMTRYPLKDARDVQPEANARRKS
jgi:hypothetical protein